jgi:hypothetical protein
VSYTPAEVRALTPVRRTVELRALQEPGLRDVFLCHAWDDRRGIATELCELLVAAGVSVWFSEKDIVLGQPFLARDLLIPVVHETTYDELRKVSPLLASRNGLNTTEDSIADVVTKIAELLAVENDLSGPLASAD